MWTIKFSHNKSRLWLAACQTKSHLRKWQFWHESYPSFPAVSKVNKVQPHLPKKSLVSFELEHHYYLVVYTCLTDDWCTLVRCTGLHFMLSNNRPLNLTIGHRGLTYRCSLASNTMQCSVRRSTDNVRIQCCYEPPLDFHDQLWSKMLLSSKWKNPISIVSPSLDTPTIRVDQSEHFIVRQ